MTSGQILAAARWGTAAFAILAIAAASFPDTLGPDTLGIASLVLDVALFAAGCALFLRAYLLAVERSRTESIGVGGLYFLTGGVAPPEVRRVLLGAVVAQSVVALGTAVARPYTNLAAGVLVPVFGLGLCGLWGARFGTFPPRPLRKRGDRRRST